MAKKKYATWTLEQHVMAPRTVAWETLLKFVAAVSGRYTTEGSPAPHGAGAVLQFPFDGVELTERVVTLEPPWRRVYEITDGAPVAFYQGTTTIRDDGDECHIAWCAVFDPLPDGASGDFAERSRDAIAGALQQIAKRAEETASS